MERTDLLTQLRAYVHEATALQPSDDELILAALRLAHRAQDELVIEVLAQVAQTQRRRRN